MVPDARADEYPPALHEDIRSVAFCCISTGEFRFPKDLAADIAVRTVCDWLLRSDSPLEKVVFNVFTQQDYGIYAGLFRAN
jgi:O-acetyl-ADP-ribose deacetylase (regulator of RNase III)